MWSLFWKREKIYVLGNGVGIGKDFINRCRIVTFHGQDMMGENVLFQGGHTFANPNVPIGSEGNLSDTPLEVCRMYG